MADERYLEICLAYELRADDLVAREERASLGRPGPLRPRFLLFRRDAQFPAGRWWQVAPCEMASRAVDLLAGEQAAFWALAPRLAGRLMRDDPLGLSAVRLEWGALVGPGRIGVGQAWLAVRMAGLATEPALYEFLVDPWTADLRYGILASEPLPFEPVTRLRRRRQARVLALVEPESLAHLAACGDRLSR